MHTRILVLACLTFASQGRKVQRAAPQHLDNLHEEQLSGHDGGDSSLESLADLLQASGLAVACQITVVTHNRSLILSTTQQQAFYGHGTGKDAAIFFANTFFATGSKVEPGEEVDERISDEFQENFNEVT